ncbi:hypothetical protein [Anaerospora hongkongensis]|uniref:hypothetical protein n=1 Tax=Anaerospora hongkongensis TaxID=244830 RepID=UPI00289B4BF2|nr:hypothetical protein [Anaerospora hongkongensis]
MDRVGIAVIKNAYQQDLIELDKLDKSAELAQKDMYEPIFTARSVHPEEEPDTEDMNTALVEIALDLVIINREIADSANAFDSLMEDIKLRLDAVDQQLHQEEERLKDINILCGNYTDFDRVVTLTDADFEGNFSTEQGTTFMAYATKLEPVTLQVMQVRGNGYEGNEFVYANGKFLKETIDTSKQEFVVDDSMITAYEYSRLTADVSEKLYPPPVNFDREEAECGIMIGSLNYFNTIKVTSDFSNVIIRDVLTSSDNGVTFTSALSKEIKINNQDAKYESGAYAYGSGIICFPSTKYLKIVFRSQGTTTDKIAFKNIDTTDAANPKETVVNVESAKRHIVRINNIQARVGAFAKTTTLISNELVSSPVKSIAIFANEYVPEHFPAASYFKYVLNINGIDHEITPINSQQNGVKIVKTSDYVSIDSTIKHINESVKNAILTVVITAPNGVETPYVSNIKVCLGKGETKDV